MSNLFGLDFYRKELSSLVNELECDIKNNRKASIFTPNVDHIINNSNNEVAKELYSNSEYIIADGWPVVMAGRIKQINFKRITGVDLMDELLILSNKNKYSLFFLGAEESTLQKLENNIRKKYSNIELISYHHGYFDNDEEVIEKINNSNSKILFVGMGNPKQEIWIRKNFEKINCNLMIGVGGAFKIFSEEVSRAPRWVQRIGMEWFYRFCKEPKRLFSRYFIKYPAFLKILIKEMT